MKSIVYVCYKTFENWCEPVPMSVYTTFDSAVKAMTELNNKRTDEELEAGLLYYVNMKGVPLYD